MESPTIPDSLFTVSLYPAVSRAVYALVALKVPDLLANGPRSVEDLAQACAVKEQPLRQIIRTAATTDLFRTEANDVYALTENGRYLCEGHPDAGRDLVLTHSSPVFHDSLGAILETLRTGRTGLDINRGQNLFEYYSDHPDEYESFNRMMRAHLGDTPSAVAETYDFPGGGRVVDCGGGIGTLLFSVLAAHDNVTGTLFDQPPVIEQALAGDIPEGLEGRWDSIAGNFFESVPAGGNFYLLSHIIHDWNDEQAIAILRQCAQAAAPGARIVLVEEVVPEGDEPNRVKMLDVVLASVFAGIERTVAEYVNLFAAAGMRLNRVMHAASTVFIVEAVLEPASGEKD